MSIIELAKTVDAFTETYTQSIITRQRTIEQQIERKPQNIAEKFKAVFTKAKFYTTQLSIEDYDTNVDVETDTPEYNLLKTLHYSHKGDLSTVQYLVQLHNIDANLRDLVDELFLS